MYLSNGQVVLNPSSAVDVLARHVQSPGGAENKMLSMCCTTIEFQLYNDMSMWQCHHDDKGRETPAQANVSD